MASKKPSNELTEEDIAKFDWLTLRKEMDEQIPTETRQEKFIRKFAENPFVPLGCLATTGALIAGLWSFRTGRKKMSQYMMRTRIAAQGLTVLAMVLGVVWGTQSIPSKSQPSGPHKNGN